MLELNNISLKLGEFSLENINLKVNKGDYFVLLGVSGAGKSILLEMIAGMLYPDKGTIILQGKDITNVKIQERGVGLVFQDYAIFPNMTVKQNIAFPLKCKKLNKKGIEQKINEIAEIVNISHLLHRKPESLSGGEQQRVALGRILTLEPKCLLLDEPLSSLDAQLRDGMQTLLRKINRMGQTIIHVTHDYREAISLANKLAVLYEGQIIQTGTPKEVFHNPGSKFVANFTGIKNFYNALLEDQNTAMVEDKVRFSLKDMYTGVAWLSSARVVRCWVKSRNERNHRL